MKFMFWFFSVMSLLFIKTSFAQNGERAGNGGDIVVCADSEAVTLDYYQASLPLVSGAKKNLVDIAHMSAVEVDQYFEDWIKKNTKLPIGLYKGIKIKLGKSNNWTDTDLEVGQDMKLAFKLREGCELRRGANRQGEVMFGDSKNISMLSESQLALLENHEYLYYLFGFETSEEIRDSISVILNLEPRAGDLKRIQEKFTKIKNVPNLEAKIEFTYLGKGPKNVFQENMWIRYIGGKSDLKIDYLMDIKFNDIHPGSREFSLSGDQRMTFKYSTSNFKFGDLMEILCLGNRYLVRAYLYDELVYEKELKKGSSIYLNLMGF